VGETITRNGRLVAKMVSCEFADNARDAMDRVEEFRKLREAVAKRGGSGTAGSVKKLIRQGRM
jgi:hypothetical protein